MRVFALVKARGQSITPEQIKAALRDEFTDDPLITSQEADEVIQKYRERLRILERAARFEAWGAAIPILGATEAAPAPAPTGETISQAAEAWFAEMTRDPSAAPREQTMQGHRLRVKAFVDRCRDLPLTDVTRAMASDFLASLKVTNRTRNGYAQTLASVFESARRRGRFTGDNPFDGQKAKVVKSSYERFEMSELQKLFDSLPREITPKKHTPETALPWAALIALYSGARLEEIAQLKTADVREEKANGATVWCIDIHNGGENHLKNESAPRLVPVHSALVRAGLLDYVAGLKAGPLWAASSLSDRATLMVLDEIWIAPARRLPMMPPSLNTTPSTAAS